MNNTTFKSPARIGYRGIPVTFNSWFDTLLKENNQFVPSVNIIENKENFEIEFSVPGYSKEDFKIQLKDDVLSVTANHETENKVEEKQYARREFTKQSFSRSFSLSDLVNRESVEARYENGILTIVIAKKTVNTEEHTKEIKVS